MGKGEAVRASTVSSGRVTRAVLKVLLVVLFVLAAWPASGLVAGADPAVSWRGEYYNNTSLGGAPALVRDDATVSFNWGSGSPGPGVNADYFSVRWTTFAYFSANTYNFYVTVDDGARLWVDDQLIIDEWRDGAERTVGASRYMTAGYHSIRLEYYEAAGAAVIRAWWDTGGAPPPITDWRGEYYNNTWLGGDPAVVRNDAAINFDWGYGSPAAGVAADNFSARWTRTVSFPTSGNYTFSATVDDGVRVWVDGTLVIDKWFQQSRTTHTGTIYLAAGNHPVRVEYFEAGGVALCQVSWSGGGAPAAQEVIVDDRDPGFTWGGPASGWYSRNTGFRGHLYWTWNSRTQLQHWGRWTPNLPSAGNWEVYVFIASRYFGSKSARYSVYHAGGRTDRVINQNNYYDQWVSLGTYTFNGGPNEYVYLSDVTGETYATRFVGFDAVKFVKRDGGTPPPPPPPPPPSGCAITPILGFGQVWNTYASVRTKLGCPTEVERSIWAAEESFQGGYMFWRQDTRYIYVLYNNGTWQGFSDTWTESEPERDPSIVPPPGLYQPKRGFGKVWRNNPTVRSVLGWALTEERGFQGAAQQFNGGLMLWSNVKGIFVLYNDGRWERY